MLNLRNKMDDLHFLCLSIFAELEAVPNLAWFSNTTVSGNHMVHSKWMLWWTFFSDFTYVCKVQMLGRKNLKTLRKGCQWALPLKMFASHALQTVGKHRKRLLTILIELKYPGNWTFIDFINFMDKKLIKLSSISPTIGWRTELPSIYWFHSHGKGPNCPRPSKSKGPYNKQCFKVWSLIK